MWKLKKTFAVGIIVVLLLLSVPSVSADWLSGWDYRKAINITGQSGAGTHYQVNISIGNSSGGDFHLEGHCTDFPNDTVVTDDDGVTKLPFWIENASADPIQMWVNVSDDLNTSQDIYVYYGKSGENTTSNGTAAFEFFDDFDRADSADVGNDWTEDYNIGSISSNRLRVAGLGTSSTLEWDAIWKSYTASETKIYETEIELSSNLIDNRRAYFSVFGTVANTRMVITIQNAGNNVMYLINSGWVDSGIDAAINVKYPLKIVYKTATQKVDYYFNDTLLGSDQTPYAGTITNKIFFGSLRTATDDYRYYTDVLVRKYNSPEPAYSSAGSEEAPTTYTPPNPTNLQNTTGNFWVNYTWDAGSGNVTNSYNVSNQTEWFNGTTNTFYNESVSASEWVNITVYAWNSSGSGTLSAGNVSDQVQGSAADTTFTVSLPVGYTKPVFEPPNSTATNYPPNGQTDSQEFFNVTNSGNVNLDVRMKLNTTVSTITLKADSDNNPSGAKEVNTTMVTIYSGLGQGNSVNVWLWSDFDHTPTQTANRTVYINVSQT